ncbi:MAG: epoxide hydrolase family protein [Acetobacteraceae bacterium]
MTTPTPFTLHIDDAALADLRTRLSLTRFPDQAPDAPWAYGTDLAYMKELVRYWHDHFDWRAQEAALNAFPQFKVPLHGIDLHFIRAEGKGPNPMPLLLMHGWPGSVFEFLDIIPRLTDPARFGGDPKDSFTVIAPSLPGYGLSFQRGQKRFSVQQIADCLNDLMVKVLGFTRYAAQGGDWGAMIASYLGHAHTANLVGIHINLLSVRRDRAMPDQPTPEEKRYHEDLAHWLKEETGYQWIQGTRPQTLAYGLTDSPAGLGAWIAEKFRTWSDCDGVIENAIDRDRMLGNICLYWFTGAIGSSFWPYYARMHGAWPVPEAGVTAPMGYAAFPKEIMRPTRSAAERTYTDIRRWTDMPRGGHFAAMEQPLLLSEEIRAFFRPLR